jgi:predicted phosphate transport protein (TIGR00153 family)
MEFNILRKKLIIGKQIDDFLDKVSESGLMFKQGMDAYLKANKESFTRKIEEITATEHQGDSLRRSVEEQLYAKTLIPESRGDVLELLESMDSLLDRFKGVLWQFEIEQPEIPPEFNEDFRELVLCVVETVEAIVRSSRAFFVNVFSVSDHIHKVSYWETQSDKISTKLQKNIFRRQDLQLSQKMQLRDLVRYVDKIADRAEDVADKLSIYIIKRSL